MSETFMAHFGPDYVEANHLSENNSVRYLLELVGTGAGGPYGPTSVKLNGVPASFNTRRGLNMVTYNETGVQEDFRSFDTYGDASLYEENIRNYLYGLPAGKVVCIVTFDAIRSTPLIDQTFSDLGSSAWPGSELLNRNTTFARWAYAAVFESTTQKITHENSGGSYNNLAVLSVVFDTPSDLGVCGVPAYKANKPEEDQATGSEYLFSMILSGSTADLKMKTDDLLVIEADLYNSQAAVDAGVYTQVHLQWTTDGGSWLGGTSSAVNKSLGWNHTKFVVPIKDATDFPKFTIGAFRMPSGSSQDVRVKNAVVYQISKEVEDRNAAFGVNGIRAKTFGESTNTNPITELLNLKPSNVVTGTKLKERG